ncbi:hypothetical protein M413DRAFT_232930 [Hebeloma cylindrosporum]|uniref:Uncharacterized protein n=1 Tax=Hebeloma cylindrosporum TaxID=76867 RepID=A0A0C3CXB2_HEBCY|nr:hypothetical protein M413DRAFT_232930 [Hebeloma cylindrosporum h7]
MHAPWPMGRIPSTSRRAGERTEIDRSVGLDAPFLNFNVQAIWQALASCETVAAFPRVSENFLPLEDCDA